MFNKIIINVFLMFVFFSWNAAYSQETSNMGALSGASQYYLGDKDQILMNVNVWGYVRKPGQYVVPRHTDLISLISFAGGPIDGADLSKVRIIRAGQQLGDSKTNDGYTGTNGSNGTNDLHKSKGNKDSVPILEIDVKKYTKLGTAKEIPLLQAGDTVLLPQTFGHKVEKFLGFNSIVSIIAATASIAIIVERIK